MISCPLPGALDPLVEYAKSVGLGHLSENEALRAYMMLNSNLSEGEEPKIPTPEEFELMMDIAGVFTNSKDKPVLDEEKMNSFEAMSNAFPYFKELINPTPLTVQSSAEIKVGSILTQLADQLSSNLGVSYEFITKERAVELTSGINKWSGQPAFFLGNTVYIIPELANEKSVFHEFAHPVIRAIQLGNPELYKKLVAEFSSLPEAEEILTTARNTYPDLEENDPIIMEEALVMSLTKATDEKNTSAFNQFIKNLMYAIKQLLRKFFGKDRKITIEKLNPNTTLSELADLLMIQPLDIDVDSISREDLAAYATEVDDYLKAVSDFSDDAVLKGVNELYTKADAWLAVIQQNEDYAIMKEILKDFYQKSDLMELKKDLAPYQTVDNFLADEISKIRNQVVYGKERSEAFVSNLLRMKSMSERMKKAVNKLFENINDPETVGKIFYINNIVNSFEEYVEYLEDIIRDEEIDSNNPVVGLLENITSEIKSIRSVTAKVYKEGVSKIIKDTLTPMMKNIKDKYDTIYQDLIKRNAPQYVIDQLNEDYWGLRGTELTNFLKYKRVLDSGETLSSKESKAYEILKIKSFSEGSYLTPEKIDYLMSGQIKAGSAMNSFMEGYLYNQDPIVSGFALFVKDKMTDVLTTSQKNANSFLNELRPLMQEAGYNQADPGEFGARVTFLDKKGGRDENGNFISKEVYSFLTPYRDWQLALSQMQYDIDVAKEAAGISGDNTEVHKLIQEREKLMNEFFNRPFTDAYYDRFKILVKGEDDEIGKKAEAMRSEVIRRMQTLQSSLGYSTALESVEINEELKILLREYRQLHSNYTSKNQLKDAEGLAIAERLREFREAGRDLYDITAIPGQFENSLAAFEEELIKVRKLVKGSETYNYQRNKWIEDNTRVKIDESFYEYRTKLIDELESILSKLPNDGTNKENVADLQKKIMMFMNPFRDEDNQPEATAMSEEAIAEIKKAEIELEEAKKALVKMNGLTENEQDRLNHYYNLRKDNEPLSIDEAEDFRELKRKRSSMGLVEKDAKRAQEILEELAEMQKSTPTEYYLDVINNLIEYLPDMTVLKNLIGTTQITASNAHEVLTLEFYNQIASSNPIFKKWYEDNHIFKIKKTKNGRKQEVVERVKAWSITRPVSAAFYQTFEFINSDGQEEILPTMPNMNYYDKVIKDKYLTKQITMQEAIEMGDPTLANVMFRSNDPLKARFLPKLNAPDNRFRNDKFFQVRDNDPKLFKALLAMSKWHLKFQEGNPYSSRLFMEVPRFRKHTYEITREVIRTKENPISKWWRNLWKLVRNSGWESKDPYDQGLNFEDQLLGMQGEMFIEDENSTIPIHGLANLDPNEVSLNLTYGIMKYMISSEQQRALIKMNPTARALQNVVNDPNLTAKHVKQMSGRMMRVQNIVSFASEKFGVGNKKGDSIRAKTINNFIEREFEGKVNKGVLGNDKETQWVSKFANGLMKMSAFGYFALDIGSAAKNAVNSRIQSMVEAAGGRYYNHQSYVKGSMLASKMSAEMSFEVYKFGPKSKTQQMAQIFDAYQGELEKKLPEIGSRSLAKDAFGVSWALSFRKWTEVNSTLANFFAMMYHQTVPMTVDGKTEYIAYVDAWEMGPDNQIRLKDGVDKAWDIGGTEFKRFKNKVQGVTNNLIGAFAKFEYAEADRYLTFRWVANMKRWFLRMMLSRYQFRGKFWNPKYRYDTALQDTVMGYHVETLRYIINGLRTMGKTLPYMTPSEKVALIKTLMDVVYLTAFSYAALLVFGFDDEDEDKYLKLREKSGPIPFPFISDTENEFELKGWLSNQLLFLTLQTENELASITPFTATGLRNYYGLLTFKSTALGNTISNYIKIFEALYHQAKEKDSGYYDQRVGPYIWMQGGTAEEGGLSGNKAAALFMKSIGFSGKAIDPATGITDLVKSQNFR